MNKLIEKENTKDIIYEEVILYLDLWESINNTKFKGGEFAMLKNNASSNTFKMSSQKLIDNFIQGFKLKP